MMTKKEIEAAGKEEYALWRETKDRVNSLIAGAKANATAHIDRFDKAVTSGDPAAMLDVFGPGGGIMGTIKGTTKAIKNMKFDKPNIKEADEVLVELPMNKINHGESAMPGGKLTWDGSSDIIKDFAKRKTASPPISVMAEGNGKAMILDGSHRFESEVIRQSTKNGKIKAYVKKHDLDKIEGLKVLKGE